MFADVCGCFEDSLWDGRRAAVPHEASTSVFYGRTGSSGSSVRTPPASMRRTTSESPFE